MNAPARTFAAVPATREHVPVLLGLMGPSGSGKSYSGLRLATGIQEICGGDIYAIDTEARRLLHYADMFKFRHIQFDPPHGSLDYLAAIEHCIKAGAKIVMVDSMSHEHSGVGGMLEFQEAELDRMAGNDWAKRERVKMLAWQKPKAARRRLIDRLLQLNANFIFCFRAKQVVKPMKINGKTEVVPQGFMPIAGDEFIFEMTANCLLMPGARGVPTWQSDSIGERQMIKPAKQFDGIFADSKPLDESIGRALAEWARGDKPSPHRTAPEPQPSDAADQRPAAPNTPPGYGDAAGREVPRNLEDEARKEARRGAALFDTYWKNLDQDERRQLKPMGAELRKLISEADAA